ncbi:MAG: flagellar hook-length control protein FliK, partial [Clostridiaceae bacterium]|nr:flagellar hook-length control protein FliK [Clostridiaceae bacterium]
LNQINAALEPTDTVQSPITENYVKNIVTLQENQTEAGAADTAGESQTNPQSAQPDILSEQEAAEQTGEKNSGRFAFAGKFLQSISENAKNTLSDTFNVLNDALKSNSASAQESSLKTPEGTLDTLLNAYTKCARNQDFVSSYLTEDERAQLVRHLQNMPVSNSLLQRIISGSAATKDILTVIQNTIPLTDSENIKNLFQSDVFQKLFSRMLQSSWTLTPEQLSDGKLSDFYTKMQNQLSQLRTLIQNTLSGADSEQLGHAAQDMENNLSFMKTLNETFSFFQMPLKLQSQDAHGDLYVYSQKEKLRQHPEKASVLLHLDMENLGKTDIRIEKNNNDLIADFSLNDNETVELFRINAAMLESALQEQGYSCRLQFKEREQPSPSVDDFINSKVNTHATTEMKRFSFDIRA